MSKPKSQSFVVPPLPANVMLYTIEQVQAMIADYLMTYHGEVDQERLDKFIASKGGDDVEQAK